MKKIVIFHTEFFFSGGAEHTLLETIDFLQKEGFEVECYAPYINKESCFPDIINKYPVYPLLPLWFFRLNLPREIYIVIAASLAPFLVFTIKNSDFFYGANQAGPYFAYIASLIHKKPYLVYMPYPQGFLFPRKIDKEFGLKEDMSIIARIIMRLGKKIFRWIDKKIIANAQSVITEGTYSQKLFKDIYKREIINCPPGAEPISDSEMANTNRFSGELRLKNNIISKPYILVTNRHMPKKKFKYAINMMAKLRTKYTTNTKMVITGAATSYTLELQKLTEELGLLDLIKFVGYTSEAETLLLYKNALVYIYPAPEEDFGKGIIQSMACGVPVVAWNNAGPSGIINNGHTGFLISPFDEVELAEKTYLLLQNKTLNQKMGIQARNDVTENFSSQRHNKIIREKIVLAV
ncbi:MAG: glycosyltransferase family 4 protein [bacterium]|nr:glycosyltransferase family 4 protein [bacterium]